MDGSRGKIWAFAGYFVMGVRGGKVFSGIEKTSKALKFVSFFKYPFFNCGSAELNKWETTRNMEEVIEIYF